MNCRLLKAWLVSTGVVMEALIALALLKPQEQSLIDV